MKRSRLLRNKYLKNQWAAAWKAFIFFMGVMCFCSKKGKMRLVW